MAAQNWADKSIFTGDNLPIMRGMNSESVDLIYLDPPFNSNANYAAPIGSVAAGAAFKDTWTLRDVDIEWIATVEEDHPALWRVILAAMRDSDKSYLAYMAVRLLEMRRILKPTGSIYLHCDPTMSHYLKLLMDAIFGRRQFRNEIAWCYTGPANTTRWFPRKHDILLFYAMSFNGVGTFNRDAVRIPYSAETMGRRGRAEGTASIVSASAETIERRGAEQAAERFGAGKVPEDWWADIPALTNQTERVGYPTQKPLALLHRIIAASAPPRGIVLDPFAGCATTLVAADRLGRSWVGIDISRKAAELVTRRIKEDQGPLFEQIVHREDRPQRTDLGPLPHYTTHKATLYGAQAGHCAGCREHFHLRNLEVDHIIAVSQGGTDHLTNLQLLCGACNRVKADRGMEYLRTKLQLVA